MNYKHIIYFVAIAFCTVACSAKSDDNTIINTEDSYEVGESPTTKDIVETPDLDGGLYIVISKQTMNLCLYDRKSKLVKKYPIACGIGIGDKRKEGDNCTPEGIFKIQTIQDASTWDHDFKDGKGVIKGAYGPKFIRLYTPPHTGIGIHGTHNPASLGTRASEGCIRMKNENVAELAKYVYSGMPVIILGSDADIKATAKDNTPRVTVDVTSAGEVSTPTKSEPALKKQEKLTPTKSEPALKKQEKLTPTKSEPALKKQDKVAPTTKATGTTIHEVKKGNTVSSIALKYGMTEAELCRLNGIKNNKIDVGQKLKVNNK